LRKSGAKVSLILILILMATLISRYSGTAPGAWIPLAGGVQREACIVNPAESPLGVVYNSPAAGKMAALTFDDGPSKKFTPQYLNVLDRHGVHATFFLVGRHIIQEDDGLTAMISGSGNEVGCHAFDHRNLEQMNLATARQDITKAKQLIEDDAHTKVVLFRPPGGHLNQELIAMINGMGMKIVLWSVDPGDWYAGPDKIVNNVLTKLQPGAIIILHEGKAATLAALPTLIKGIRQRGYQLVTVSELLAGKPVSGVK